MDIIAAHQQGLIEQLDAQIVDLAGGPDHHLQRAVVLHHVFDHSNAAHGWALIEARRAVRIAAGLAVLRRKAGGWMLSQSARDEARNALAALSAEIGNEARARCAEAYRAYRLSATKALRGEAERVLPADYLASLDACHAARRDGAQLDENCRAVLFEQTEAFAGRAPLCEAWQAINATRLGRPARRLVGSQRLAHEAAIGERKGWAWVETRLRGDKALPAAFRANPAQHFYALLHGLQEKRRNRWREACDRESMGVALAA